MKKLFLLIIFSAFSMLSNAQDVSFSLVNATSAREHFLYSYGYRLDIDFFKTKKNKFGVAFNHLFSKYSQKENQYFSIVDGKTYYREEDSNNQRISLNMHYLFRILKNEKSSIYVGPEIGLNYYKYDISIYQYLIDNPTEISNYNYDKEDNNKLGFAVNISYDYQFADNFSFHLNVQPEIALSSSITGCLISMDTTPWIQLHAGIIYHLKR